MDESSPLPPGPKTPQSTGFRRLVVMLAIVVVIAGAALVFRDAFRPPAAPPRSPLARGDDREELAPEDSITRALRLAGVDLAKKNEWVDEIPDADVSALAPGQAELFIRVANSRRCTCGCGFTLAACRRFDSTCEDSGPRVAALLDSVARGLVTGTPDLPERPAGIEPRGR